MSKGVWEGLGDVHVRDFKHEFKVDFEQDSKKAQPWSYASSDACEHPPDHVSKVLFPASVISIELYAFECWSQACEGWFRACDDWF